MNRARWWMALAGLAFVFGIAALWIARGRSTVDLRRTVGEVQTVHASVQAGGREVRGVRLFAVGDAIRTGADGRARLRLDDGTTAVVDRETKLVATDKGLRLESGRIFVQGGRSARTEVVAGDFSTVVAASAMAFERSKEAVRAYCADGEAVVRVGDKQDRVRGGETASIGAKGLEVAPEKAFNDWTGGMATPWSATGRPRPAIGELWGHVASSPKEGATPLAIRSHEVEAYLEGEVALTHVETTFFNGGSQTLSGDYRLAVPRGAIVSRFALRRGGQTSEGIVLIGNDREQTSLPRLEWAGPGSVRGFVPYVPPGEAVGVIVEYAEWLSPVGGRMTYRYPMVSEDEPPLIGELRVRIDASAAHPRSIAVGHGALIDGGVIELRKADVRPEADLVVDFEVAEPASSVRAYVAPALREDPNGDPYLLVRTELPQKAATGGVTLAIVLDTSRSIAPSVLDAGRAVIESILEGLGAGDRVVVLGADQAVRGIGGDALGAVDSARRTAIRDALALVRPGGASDVGAALESAADLLPPEAGEAMVVYVGDGFPTLGDSDIDAMRARLARRSGGIPRLAAVGTGFNVNRYALESLVRGAGPVLEVADRGAAAQAAVTLLAEALEPVVAGVEVDLGPSVDRVYPRGSLTVSEGDSLMVMGRLRGPLPASAIVRYRAEGRVVEETRSIVRVETVRNGDVRRRWAEARVDDIVRRGESIETASDVAQRTRLLTPWTSWYVTGDTSPPGMTPLAERSPEAATAARVIARAQGSKAGAGGALLEPMPMPPRDAEEDFRALVHASARRTLGSAMAGVRRCHAARGAHRPELSGTLRVRFTVDGRGRVRDVDVHATAWQDEDEPLNRCVETLVKSLRFFDSGTDGAVAIEQELVLPPPRDVAARRCSDTSRLPLALRLPVWRVRLGDAPFAEVFLQAKRGCELKIWPEQRALLEMLVEKSADGPARLQIARSLEEAGETEAATYLRQAAIRLAESAEELARVRELIVGDEPRPGKTFETQYRAAANDSDRLAVIRRFLSLSPHDPALRRLLFALLEAMGRKDVLVQEIHDVQNDPFADAALLAEGAAALRRIGREQEARRAFGELLERAPKDPYARAYAGDRLRQEGYYDDATSAFEVLEEMLPNDPAVALRLALAHAGAGRLDVAARVLERVAETGGRTEDVGLGELASVTSAVLLARAKEQSKDGDRSRIERRLLEVPLPDVEGLVLVRTPPLDRPVEPRLARADADRADSAPDLAAPSMGLFAIRLERGDGDVRLKLRRPEELPPARAVPIRVDVVTLDDRRRVHRLDGRDLELRPDGKDVVLGLKGGQLL